MKITREDVLRVAELAHLELSEAEIDLFGRQLDSTLTYAEKLNELDTSVVEPMAQVLPPGAEDDDADDAETDAVAAPSTPLREDTPVRCEIIDDVLAQAPDADTVYFRVPKVIDR
jgi:aspartyl-tRNA(Asn)/glutamyl-tRNA(Gln) amidotransferase subunit C